MMEERAMKTDQGEKHVDRTAMTVASPPSTLFYAEESIQKFSGNDKAYSSGQWATAIEENAEIFGWTPLQKLIVARRSLISTAALWLKSEKPFTTYESLKDALLKEFPDKLSSKEIHEIMSNRKKHRNETCYEYYLCMKELARRGKLADYVAIQYIVEGIPDNPSNKIMLYGVSTYADLKQKLKIYEDIKGSKNHQYSTTPHNKVVRRASVNHVRCYSCGEGDHISSACPHREKGVKCFRCNMFGHIGIQCPTRNETSTVQSLTTSSSGTFGRKQWAPRASSDQQLTRVPTEKPQSMCVAIDKRVNVVNDQHEVSDVCHPTLVALQDESSDILTNMSINEKDFDNLRNIKPIKQIIVENYKFDALTDTGSEANLINTEGFVKIKSRVNIEQCDITFSGLGLSKVKAVECFSTKVIIDGQCFTNIKFYVVPATAMPFTVILGQQFLQNAVMIMDNNNLTLLPCNENWLGRISCFVSNFDFLGCGIDQRLQDKVIDLVQQYRPNKTKESPIQLRIILKDDVPVAQRPRRLAPKEVIEVENQIQQWLRDGIIRVSYSEYASPLVLVRKKDGTLRVCIDYRMLNKKIIKDEYPLPLIEDQLDKLVGMKIFSALDLTNGYFHLKVHEESIKYTAFVTPSGQYEFLRAPFGLAICPKVFTRFINIIFRDLIAKGILITFIDDLLILGRHEDEAIDHLRQVLEVASSYGLEINWKKTQLLVRKVDYLGHTIEDGMIRPAQAKIEAVMKFPEPTTSKQLQSFLGLSSYFRKFIPCFATIARPLTDLLKQDVNFILNDECKLAFNLLKEKLTSNPVLKIYNPRLYTELHTDASSIAISAILMQKCSEDGELHPVHYMSRRTSSAESRYTSYELEALAIVEGVRKFRHYLFGINFRIVTDCKAFEMTLNKKDLAMSTKVARWILFLEDFTFTIEHREGSKMKHTDALSRNPYIAAITMQGSIREAQQTDKKLKVIKDILKDHTYEDYYLDNGILYKSLDRKLVIPSKMENEIISKAHNVGHFAKKKTMELISKDYYIEGLEKKVEDFISVCIPCLLASRKSGKQEGFLNPIQKENTPLHTLHLDHIGPMTDTKKQYNHILTFIDAFTKFVWLFPTKSTTTKETIDKLRIHQQTFGNPVRIITDRGTAFTSTEFSSYCEEENIQHIKITTGVPRGNGQVERVHRTIISVLTKLCIETPALWYRHVSRLQRALNNTLQRSITMTPYELLIGVKMRTKEDCEIYRLLQEEERESFIYNRDMLRGKAHQGILQVQEENRKSYNKNRKQSTLYKEGDLVAIKRTQYGSGLKIKPKYFGPYKVRKVKGKDRYEVEKVDDTAEGPRLTCSSADLMKKWSVLDGD